MTPLRSSTVPSALRGLVVLAAGFLLPAAASAQSPRDKVQVRAVRVGFTPGPATAETEEMAAIAVRQTLYKPGAWTPVYVDVINLGKYDRSKDGPAQVVVETPDCDDTAHNYITDLPPFDELSNTSSVIAYTRAGGRYGEFTVRVVAKGRDLCQPFRTGSGSVGNLSAAGLDPAQGLYLALGSRLPGLRPGNQTQQQNPNNPNMVAERSVVALLTRVNELPPLWLGYGAADVVILATSDRDFTTAL